MRDFPRTRELLSEPDKAADSSAAILQEHLQKPKWGYLAKAYVIGLGVFCGTLFVIIATIRLALSLF